MRNLYLDPSTYDLVVTDAFNLRFTTNLTEYVSQKIENTLSLFQGEWFLDQEAGIPYYDRILIKGADLNDVNSIFIAAVSSIPEVDEIVEFDTAYDNSLRKYTVTFKVTASETGEEIEGTVTV